MIKDQMFVELSESTLSFKDKKQIVLDYRQKVIQNLEEAVKIWQRLQDDAKKIDPLGDLFWELWHKRQDAEFQLKWLKGLSKRRTLKYALVYHWSFTQC